MLVHDMHGWKTPWDLFSFGWSRKAASMRWCERREHGRERTEACGCPGEGASRRGNHRARALGAKAGDGKSGEA